MNTYDNPGGLPTGITPRNITKKQFSRNPILTRVLSKIRYIEEVGEGWDKIIKEHKDHPLKPKFPKIESDEYSVLVEIFSTKEKFEKEKRVKETIALNPRQKKGLEYVKEKGKITSREFAVLCQEVSRKTLIRDLNELVKRGIVKQKGRKKGIHYVLS